MNIREKRKKLTKEGKDKKKKKKLVKIFIKNNICNLNKGPNQDYSKETFFEAVHQQLVSAENLFM